ncbi:MAG: hypothetical protein HY430_02120 [Candidatus Levybacteria bacterium]|nr:hypothetical protein [Candidatus Levybacteria bacterium]
MSAEVLSGFQPHSEILDWNHRGLQPVQEFATLENYIFRGNTPQVKDQLREAVKVYPEKYQPKFKKDVANYQVTEVVSKEFPHGGSDVGVVFLSGGTGTATGDAHIPAEIFLKSKENLSQKIGFAAALSSSASRDTVDTAFPSSHAERAAHQAALVVDLLKRNPTKNLFVLGHSLGALEAAYMTPILEKLIEINGLETKVAGTILAHPLSYYEQRVVSFVKKFVDYQRHFMQPEITQKYPSRRDVAQVEEAYTLAKDGGEGELASRLYTQLQEMQKRHDHPIDLTSEQEAKLINLDEQIDQLWFGQDRRFFKGEVWPKSRSRKLHQLEKERRKMLKPLVQDWMQTGDMRGSKVPMKANWRVVRAVFLRKLSDSTIRPLPQYVREQLTGNVAVVLGEIDQLFKADEALSKMELWTTRQQEAYRKKNPDVTDEELEEVGQFFPNASSVHEAIITNWSHHAPATDSGKHGAIVTDLMKRMLTTQEQPDKKTQVYYH